MTKIQELAERAKVLAGGLLNPQYTKLVAIIDELAGIAEAPQVWYSADQHPNDVETGKPMTDNEGHGYSDNVLIDLDGWRKDFAIGWYDHDNKEWMFHQEDKSLLDLNHMKWTYLPLAKYDKK